MVCSINHEDISPGIDGNAVRFFKLTLLFAALTESSEELTLGRELLDTGVPGIGHIEIAALIHSQPARMLKLPTAISLSAGQSINHWQVRLARRVSRRFSNRRGHGWLSH